MISMMYRFHERLCMSYNCNMHTCRLCIVMHVFIHTYAIDDRTGVDICEKSVVSWGLTRSVYPSDLKI